MSTDLMRYLPEFLRNVLEYRQIYDAEDPEFDLAYAEVDKIFPEALIMDCSETRIIQWENALGITPQGTLEERRYYIKGILNGKGKLNEFKIKDIAESYSGGSAIVTFSGSVINVKITPPSGGEVFRFEDIERTLRPLIPAHLGLAVERFYSTWADIKNNFADWTAVKAMDDWEAVKDYIEE